VSGREREVKAAAAIRECRSQLAERGGTIVAEAMAEGVAEPIEWRRYPEGEVYDPSSHAQYFYHSHPTSAPPSRSAPIGHQGSVRQAERGHFHLFLRAEGVPRGISPLLFPEATVANVPTPPQAAPLRHGASDRVAHLVAIAIDRRGEPVRLFTTNRWVTGETWYRGEDVARMLDRFTIGDGARGGAHSPLLNRWLGALVRLFHADIERLLERRDQALREWRWRWPRRGSAFEDTRLEIPSDCEIDLEARLAEIEHLAARPPGAARRRRATLPPMAEGWGA